MQGKKKFSGKGNILLLERDPDVRAAVARALTLAGYAVFEAEDGFRAFLLNETLALPLHLLIADACRGRDMSGVELSRHLQVLRPGLRALYLSEIPANPDLRRELQSKLDSYLSRPFSDADLLAKVDVLMEKASARTRQGLETSRAAISPGPAMGAQSAPRR